MTFSSPLQEAGTLLIGSRADIAALAQKSSARMLVASDSHGATENLSLILKERGKDCDVLLFCGDGMEDVASVLERGMRSKPLAADIPPVIAVVQGNNDARRYTVRTQRTLMRPLSPYADITVPADQTLTVCGHTVFMTHGHRYSLYGETTELKNIALQRGAAIALFGHTHVAVVENYGSLLILNPGSCARPRGGQPPCYAVITVTQGSLAFDHAFYEVSASGTVPYTPTAPRWMF